MIDNILAHKKNDDICYASAPVHTMETRHRIRDLRKDKVVYKYEKSDANEINNNISILLLSYLAISNCKNSS